MVTPTKVHQVLESVLEVSASSLARGVTIAIDCKAELTARFDTALVERVPAQLGRQCVRDIANAGRTDHRGGAALERRGQCRDRGDQHRPRRSPRTSASQLFVKYVRG